MPQFPASINAKHASDKSSAQYMQTPAARYQSSSLAMGQAPGADQAAATDNLELQEVAEMDVGNGSRYKGQWRGQQWHGYGTFTRPNGQIYEGEFVENRAQGKGKLTAPNGSTYDGEWYQDRAHGFGKYVHVDQSVYEGQCIKISNRAKAQKSGPTDR